MAQLLPDFIFISYIRHDLGDSVLADWAVSCPLTRCISCLHCCLVYFKQLF